jgi:magnesium-transporting ATPase (P-type)
MDSLGSLALATEGPSKTVLDCPPIHRSASLMTPGMIRNVAIVSAYQIIVILCMMFSGAGDSFTLVPDKLFKIFPGDTEEVKFLNDAIVALRQSWRYTVVYNFFIFVQIFNEFSSRRIKNELNIFEGILQNFMFLGVIVCTALF